MPPKELPWHIQILKYPIMKQFIFALCLILSSIAAKADQLAWISLEQAQEATEYLKKQKQVILWCACCDNDSKTMVLISSITYKQVSDEYYQVVLVGKTASGQTVTEELDLAYVHVNINGEARCLGTVLEYECDPCTEPFSFR
jgi:hypothetical protein